MYRAVFSGQLLRPPFVNRIFPATIGSRPLACPADFGIMASLPRSAGVPVLLGFAEYYRLLTWMADTARSCLRNVELFIFEVPMPGGCALSEALLADDVFLCRGGEELAVTVAELGTSVLLVRDKLLRHVFECGDNSVEIVLLSTTAAADGLLQYAGRLRTVGIAGELSVGCYDEARP